MKSTLTHKEMAAHIRKRIKASGIKAKCRMQTGLSGSGGVIQVITPTFESRFTSDEIHTFCTIAKVNGLTHVMSAEIDPDHESRLTGKQQWDFHL